MPAFTFTADSSNEQLTIAAHGLVTGDGPAAVRNVGGALPNPLAPVTDYWVIRVDANTIKLATSSANALLGTAINLTTNGTGTNTLEIGIPYRRARTYLTGSQLKSLDLNALQDALVAVHDLFTAQAQSIWTGVQLAGALTVGGTLGVTGLITATAGLTAAANQHVTLSGTGEVKHGDRVLVMSLGGKAGTITLNGSVAQGFPISCRVGDRIKVVQTAYNRNSTTLAIHLRYVDVTTGTDTAVLTVFTDNSSSGWQNRTDDIADHTIVSGRTYFMRFGTDADGPAATIAGCLLTIDRP